MLTTLIHWSVAWAGSVAALVGDILPPYYGPGRIGNAWVAAGAAASAGFAGVAWYLSKRRGRGGEKFTPAGDCPAAPVTTPADVEHDDHYDGDYPAQLGSRHYEFAHTAFPRLAFGQFSELLELAGTDEGDEMLADLWARVGDATGATPDDQGPVPEAPTLERAGVAGHPAVLVHMPPGGRDAAHQGFVTLMALAVRCIPRLVSDDASAAAPPRYFLLNLRRYPPDRDGVEPRESTSVAELTPDGRLRPHFRAPAPRADAFIVTVAEVLGLANARWRREGSGPPRADP